MVQYYTQYTLLSSNDCCVRLIEVKSFTICVQYTLLSSNDCCVRLIEVKSFTICVQYTLLSSNDCCVRLTEVKIVSLYVYYMCKNLCLHNVKYNKIYMKKKEKKRNVLQICVLVTIVVDWKYLQNMCRSIFLTSLVY